MGGTHCGWVLVDGTTRVGIFVGGTLRCGWNSNGWNLGGYNFEGWNLDRQDSRTGISARVGPRWLEFLGG